MILLGKKECSLHAKIQIYLKQTLIRKLRADDFEIIFEWENSEELWLVSDESGPYSREIIAAFIDRCLNSDSPETERWVIMNEMQEPVGVVDLLEIDYLFKSAGIGIFIANVADRKKGYAKRALLELISVLEKRKWKFIKALIHQDNIASASLFKSIGFSPGGEQLHRGKLATQFVYCIAINKNLE